MQQLNSSMIGAVSWVWPPLFPHQLAEKLGEVGLRKVQLAMQLPVEDPEGWACLPEVFAERGVRLVSGMWKIRGGVISDEKWQDNLASARAASKVAEQFGVRLMTSHIGVLPEEGDAAYELVLQRVKTLAEVLDTHGCEFIFETGPESSTRLCRFLDALDEIGSPEIGINYDPANMLIYNTDDPIEALRRFLPRIKQCHLKDALPPGSNEDRGKETPIGEGGVNWRAFLECLGEQRYQGDLIIERESGDNKDQDVIDSVAYISGLMEEVAASRSGA